MSDDSLYMRAKDTMKVQFDDLQMSEPQKAEIVAQHVASMTTSLSSTAMQMALSWAKEERDGAYDLAKVKADTERALADALKAKEEICLVQKQTESQCANIEATIAGSIRENGKVATYDSTNTCKPTELVAEGLKYEQTKQVEGATYQIYADAFRKSGKVQIGTDTTDTVTKGLSGDDDGYTNQQSKNAERQRVAYEDSKRNHAANSASAMIGQLLSSETFSDENKEDVDRWRASIDYLNQDREDYI